MHDFSFFEPGVLRVPGRTGPFTFIPSIDALIEEQWKMPAFNDHSVQHMTASLGENTSKKSFKLEY